VGYAKPDPQLFWHVIRQAGCRPAEAMMVGDRLDNDILPAQKLGLATAQILLENTFGAPPAHILDVRPDFRVSSLWELAQKLVPDVALEMSDEASRMQRSSL
jgi:FMN phosphatase YigB (HAD superfamily)